MPKNQPNMPDEMMPDDDDEMMRKKKMPMPRPDMPARDKMPMRGTVTLRGEEVFSAGEYNGDAYNEKDLDQMVEAYAALKGRLDPPLKLGHNDAQSMAKQMPAREDGMPAMGWVENLRRSGKKLLADFVQVPGQVADWIKEGRYKKKSAEIYWNFKDGGKTYPRALKAVALLGADIPANRDIASLTQQFDDEGNEYRTAEYAAAEGDDNQAATQVATLEEIETELTTFGDKLASVTKGRVGAPAIRQFLSEIRSKVKTLMGGRRDHDEQDATVQAGAAATEAVATEADVDQAPIIATHNQATEEVVNMSELDELNRRYTDLEGKFTTFADKLSAAETKLGEAEAAKAKAEAEAKVYADKLAAVETSLAEEKKARRYSELRQVVAAFPHIPGTVEEKADKLYRLEQASVDLYTERLGEWKALDAQLAQGDLFRQTAYGQEAPPESAAGRFDKLVADEVAKGKDLATATEAVASAQPRLYAEYQREHERRAARGGDQ